MDSDGLFWSLTALNGFSEYKIMYVQVLLCTRAKQYEAFWQANTFSSL